MRDPDHLYTSAIPKLQHIISNFLGSPIFLHNPPILERQKRSDINIQITIFKQDSKKVPALFLLADTPKRITITTVLSIAVDLPIVGVPFPNVIKGILRVQSTRPIVRVLGKACNLSCVVEYTKICN
jgi:hypothetical protein